MKAHIGVDHQTKLIQSVAVTAVNAHDSQVLGDLLHGGETRAAKTRPSRTQKTKLVQCSCLGDYRPQLAVPRIPANFRDAAHSCRSRRGIVLRKPAIRKLQHNVKRTRRAVFD
jgi:hypothetical protein